MQGLENLSSRRIAELLWALGWEPHFEARKIRTGENLFVPKVSSSVSTSGSGTQGTKDMSLKPKVKAMVA
jgi:hypothetical protein